MKTAYLLLRVSTSKQADEGESWDLQELRGRRYADQHGIQIAKIYKEPYSGREKERPVLNQVFADIESNKQKVDYVIIPDIDRFTRGGSYWYESFKNRLLKCGVELLDVSGVIQPTRNTLETFGFEYEWSRTSPSRTSEALAAETARDEVTKILTRCIGQEINLVNQGYWTREAPLGYENKRIEDAEGKRKIILVEHPKEGIWLKTMFELRAEGVLDDPEICDRINAMGFKTRIRKRRERFSRKPIGTIGGNILTPKYLQELIVKPIYCGIVLEKWTKYKPVVAPWQGLVSIDLFNKANYGKIQITEQSDNSVMVDHGTPKRKRQRENPLYPFRFVVRCPQCRKSLLGSASRGRHGKTYSAYHCSRGHKLFRIRHKIAHETIEKFAHSLRFKPEITEAFETVAREEWHRQKAKALTLTRQSGENVVELQKEQEHLVSQFACTESPVMKKLLEKQVEDLEIKIALASDVRKKHEQDQENLNAYLARIRYIMKRPAELLLDTAHQFRLQQIWALVFDELPTYTDLLDGTPKLSVAFEVCGNSEVTKSEVVASLRSRWNLFMCQVEKGAELQLPKCTRMAS